MTADLAVPPWAPRPVRIAAPQYSRAAFASRDLKTAAIVQRLAADPRMRQVWLQFARRNRRTGEFLFKTYFGFDWRAQSQPVMQMHGREAVERVMRDTMLHAIFTAAVEAARQKLVVVSRTDLRRRAANAARMNAQITVLLSKFAALGASDSTVERFADPLTALRRDVGEIRRQSEQFKAAAPQRLRSERLLHGFAVAMAEQLTRLIGIEAYATVSTLANVVFDRHDVTAATVRSMLRQHRRRTLPARALGR